MSKNESALCNVTFLGHCIKDSTRLSITNTLDYASHVNFRFNHFDLCFSSPGIKNQSDRVQFSSRQFPKCAVISQTTWLLPAGNHVTRAANEITRIGREILDRKSGKSTIISAFSRQTSHRGGLK